MSNKTPSLSEMFPHLFGVIAATSEQGLLTIGARDQYVAKDLVTKGACGLEELHWLQKFIKSDERVLIVGSYIGIFAIPLSRHVKEIVAIEANPLSYRFLRCNMILNDVTNMTAHNFAANDTEGSLRFFANTVNAGGSKRFPITVHNMYFYDNPQILEVPAVRLDDLLLGEAFDVICMDIEGSETFALRGMPNILKTCRALIVEFLPHHLALVANVTVDEFAATIEPYFEYGYIPHTGEHFPRSDFSAVLNAKFQANLGYDNIVFSKHPLQ